MSDTVVDIQDFGEKIGGAKKDLWRSRGLQISDLDDINSREYGTFVTKDNIWPEPNYVEMVEAGAEPVCAYFVKNVRDTLPRAVSEKMEGVITREKLEKYITFVQQTRDVCLGIKEKGQISLAFSKLFTGNGYMDRGYFTDKARNNPGVTNKTIKYMQVSNRFVEELNQEVEIMNFPYTFRGDLKGLSIKYDGRTVDTKKDVYSICKGYHRVVRQTFETREDALKYAKTTLIEILDANKNNKKSDEKKKLSVRPQLAHLQRTGPKRINADVTTDEILNKFRFRGGEFGNWNNQKDRQACLNLAYEAFIDLAMATNIPVENLSLGGYDNKKLAIAFGARGSGAAAAHYEPQRVVINLTKMSGAGCLAHEWGHAFDDYLGAKLGLKGYISENARADRVATDIEKAYKQVRKAMKEVDATPDNIVENAEKSLKTQTINVEYYINECIRSFKCVPYRSTETRKESEVEEMTKLLDKAKNSESYTELKEDFDKAMEYFKAVKGKVYSKDLRDTLFHRISYYMTTKKAYEDAKNGVNLEQFKTTKDSIYYKSAKGLDREYGAKGKTYYSQEVELFARAFESYVEDKLGFKSDYLVHGTHTKVRSLVKEDEIFCIYPDGEERVRINKAIDNLIDIVRKTYMSNKGFNGSDVITKVDKKETSIETKKADKVESTKPVAAKQEGRIVDRINSSKELRDILSNVKPLELKVTNEKLAELFSIVKSIGIVHGPVPYRRRELNSKAVGIKGDILVVCNDSNVKFEKQLEGLIEAVVRKTTHHMVKQDTELVIEGSILCICKQLGLNVKTYCLSDEYEELVKDKSRLGIFLKNVSGMSSAIKNKLNLK